MTVRSLAAGTVAVAAVATIVGGPVSAQSETPAVAQVRPVVFGSPLPRHPAPQQQLPTTGQLTDILMRLADPDVSDEVRSDLVQGGIDSERREFRQRKLAKAAARGELPLLFAVGNVWSVGPDTAAAETTVSSPKLPARDPEVFTFVDEGGQWRLSSDSAAMLLEAISER